MYVELYKLLRYYSVVRQLLTAVRKTRRRYLSDVRKVEDKLIRNEYIYVYQKDLAYGVTSWERRRDKCQTRVKLDRNDAFLQEVND